MLPFGRRLFSLDDLMGDASTPLPLELIPLSLYDVSLSKLRTLARHFVILLLCIERLFTLAARGLEEPRNSQELLTESVDSTKLVGPLPFSA